MMTKNPPKNPEKVSRQSQAKLLSPHRQKAQSQARHQPVALHRVLRQHVRQLGLRQLVQAHQHRGPAALHRLRMMTARSGSTTRKPILHPTRCSRTGQRRTSWKPHEYRSIWIYQAGICASQTEQSSRCGYSMKTVGAAASPVPRYDRAKKISFMPG